VRKVGAAGGRSVYFPWESRAHVLWETSISITASCSGMPSRGRANEAAPVTVTGQGVIECGVAAEKFAHRPPRETSRTLYDEGAHRELNPDWRTKVLVRLPACRMRPVRLLSRIGV